LSGYYSKVDLKGANINKVSFIMQEMQHDVYNTCFRFSLTLWDQTSQDMFVTIDRKKIWYTDKGAGIPVILIHGYLETSEIWESFAERLSKEFRVIAIDLPGHGRSESFSSQAMEIMAGVVKEVLDSAGIRKAVVAGHSLGGYVTLAFLEYYPEYLKGYCLFHSHPLPDTEQAVEKRKREIAAVLEGKKDLMYPDNIEKMYATVNLEKLSDKVDRSKKIAASVSGEGIIAVLNGMMSRPSRVRVMEEAKVPCLWILGRLDNYIPYDAIQKRVNLPGNATTVVLEGSGHMGFVEEEDRSVEVVTEFLRRAG
jgi:pimeloyl-ACP methyl ester carboxylesterase